MSNVSTMHDVRSYTGNEKALDGQRLVTLASRLLRNLRLDS